jgi:hypothetical protein
MEEFFAYSIEGKPKSEWQGQELFERIELFYRLELLERLKRFERLIRAGLWHDLGKFQLFYLFGYTCV